MNRIYLIALIILIISGSLKAQIWGINNSRTDSRDNAGLQGNEGAVSGFYQTDNPINFPAGATSWWHLLDVRHDNPTNNYAMQFSGSFFDQNLYFRKTNNNATAGWLQFLTINPANGTLSSERIIARTVAGQTFFTGHQLGGTYSFPDGIFRAVTDNTSGATNYYFDGVTAGTRNYYVRADGQGYFANSVAIGTTDNKGYKLAVAGSIISESVTVKLQSQWPDYVFKSTYKLPSLSTVKAYIDNNQHLPEMPSEAEVAKDGVNLGEMNKLLLKKVEELTLYLVEKDNQYKVLVQRLEKLETSSHQKTKNKVGK